MSSGAVIIIGLRLIILTLSVFGSQGPSVALITQEKVYVPGINPSTVVVLEYVFTIVGVFGPAVNSHFPVPTSGVFAVRVTVPTSHTT